jgi:hypothetical protein
MSSITLSTTDIDNVIKKMIKKFENSTLEIDELYVNKNYIRYENNCIAQNFYIRMRHDFMDSNIKIDMFSANQLKIIKWLNIKRCTKNKCGQWQDVRTTFSSCSKCKIVQEEKKKKIKFMSIVKSSVCIETDICSICMDDMNEGQQISKLCCNHCFHPTCIEQLVLKHKKQQCPNCRTDINTKRVTTSKKKK